MDIPQSTIEPFGIISIPPLFDMTKKHRLKICDAVNRYSKADLRPDIPSDTVCKQAVFIARSCGAITARCSLAAINRAENIRIFSLRFRGKGYSREAVFGFSVRTKPRPRAILIK